MLDTPKTAAAAVARATQKTGAHSPETIAARGDLLAAKIAQLVDAAPPLTDEQIVRLTAILRPTR